MATRTPSNDGYDWGAFPDSSELPNVSGSATQDADLTVGARAFVPGVGAYTCSVPTLGAAEWSQTGSFVGPGGATIVGPFTGTTAVGPVLCLYASGPFVAPRAGSITAVSGWLDSAATDDSIVVEAFIGASPTVFAMTFADGGATEAYATAAAGTYAVAAGETVVMTATGGPSLSNTPAFVGSVEFTPS